MSARRKTMTKPTMKQVLEAWVRYDQAYPYVLDGTPALQRIRDMTYQSLGLAVPTREDRAQVANRNIQKWLGEN
jgi:hypothetical protein